MIRYATLLAVLLCSCATPTAPIIDRQLVLPEAGRGHIDILNHYKGEPEGLWHE